MATPKNETDVVVEQNEQLEKVETNQSNNVVKNQKEEKLDKKQDKNNKKQKKAKKSREVKVSKAKETVSELKKVSWPTFGKVVKQTLVVIGMVLFFTIVLFAIDQLLGLGYNQFSNWISKN